MDIMGNKNSLTSSVMNIGRKGASLGRNALVSVVNIHQQINPSNFVSSSSSSSTPKSPNSGSLDKIGGFISSGSSILFGNLSSHDNSNSGQLKSPLNKPLDTILEELGLYDDGENDSDGGGDGNGNGDGDRELERLALFYQFNKLCEGLSVTSTGRTVDSDDLMDDSEIRILPIERFVIDLLKRGFEPQWCDAAFRAFSTNNLMNKYEYTIAIKTLEITERNMSNKTWIELRRYLVFIYYDRTLQKKWTQDNFYDFLHDLSISKNDRPESFGIVNKVMMNIPESVILGKEKPEDNMTLIQEYAITKVQLAQKQSEYEELTLNYLKLEKQLCAMKLKVATMSETMEEAGIRQGLDDS